MPKLSIITVNLNNNNGLRQTIKSVVNQTFSDYEYIIIDGASTDGSINTIKEYQNNINIWQSKHDRGIFDAMNIGIGKASGEYCLFLNSGDYLLNNDILAKLFSFVNKEDIIYSNIKTIDSSWIYPQNLSIFFFANKCIGHPATIIKRNLFDKIGLYDLNYKITADFDFLLKCFKKNCMFKFVNLELTFFDTTGASSQQKSKKLSERDLILMQHFPDIYQDIKTFINDQNELYLYRNSRLIQIIKRFQSSPIYKKLKNQTE